MGMGFTPFGPGDRVIVTRAMFWVAGFVATLFYSLNNGACLITTSDGSPANVARLIEEEGGNALAGDVGWFDVLRESDALKAAQLDVVRLNMDTRSEEHTSELQSLMRTSYAVFCLKKKTNT